MMNEETINAKSPKTIRRHLEYLVAIKALTVTQEGFKRVYRLDNPTAPVPSQKAYRIAKGMSEYSYVKKHAETPVVAVQRALEASQPARIQKPAEQIPERWDDSWFKGEEPSNAPKNDVIFLSAGEAKFAEKAGNFAPEKANFAPILKKHTESVTETKKILPPKAPPRSPDEELFDVNFDSENGGSLRDPDGLTNSRQPITFGRSDQTEQIKNSSQENENDMSECLTPKKKPKVAKTERERRAEALQKANQGHIVNPNGIVNNRKKECNWKLARDIGPTGAVTTAQLWRHLVKHYDKAFGPGIMENMISRDKTSLSSTFDDIKQTFIKLHAYEASLRDLAEYFDWFFEPRRLDSIMKGSSKFVDPKTRILHFKNICATAFLERFYSEVIEVRKLKQAHPSELSKADDAILYVNQAFDEIRTAMSGADNDALVSAIVGNGFALSAQCMYEDFDLDESECKRRIISAMAEFLKTSPVPDKALEYLKLANGTTKEHAIFLRKGCIWLEWEEKTKDLITLAIKSSGVNFDGKQ